ncbi:MAG TPA: PQQ-dependent sugar dehydrogenase [Bacteroidales bacterium]|jgi:glucose/arabinose dehydrogenase|nr:PQQ-dependent sugar dehydrogenase [Proteiniphilum sp.]MDD3555287.1 PQQ-dependent sugar dehydrogenase [Proteiniphilum sp.]MDY0181948.1 PQQ-dependent sugar dehydrogenase [Proteiniphilum sp.]HHT35393.1 PQQ-dependent sugar dehydrogenase [Bacteroidales bacterium]
MYTFKIGVLFLLSSLLLSATCERQKSNDATPEDQISQRGTLPPVENRDPNIDYAPAFVGQTRIGGVKTTTPYEVTVIAEGLAKPWAVTALPDGRLLITQKAGSLRIATSDGTLSNAITGFPEVDDRGQGGLLDVAPAPDFASSRMLFFTLAERTAEGSLTAVGKGRLSDDETTIEQFRIIYRAIPYFDNSMHFGSRLLFNKEGNLFVSTGERSDLATRYNAQKLETAHGKVVHITPEGEPVAGNPFIGQEGTLAEIYSYGHRNPQGLDIHPVTGELWLSEMGPRGGDELNLIKPGKDYGWPAITYGIEYNGNTIGEGITAKEGMEQPVYYWDPVLSPSGMAFYAGNAIPEWQNNLFIGGLNSNHIARLVIEGDSVVGEERLLADEGQRFRDVGAGNDGALYAVTDEGRLYRVAKAD